MYYELLHKACVELKKNAEAEIALEFLLKKFPDNIEYLKQYQKINSLGTREAFVKARVDFKSKIARVYELCYIEDAE